MNGQTKNRRSAFASVVSIFLFALGAGLCSVFLSRMFGWGGFVLALSVFVVVRCVAEWSGRGSEKATRLAGVGRIARLAAWTIVVGFELFAFYLAVAWGGVLWWATSWWVWLAVAVLSAAWFLGLFARRSLPRVPILLPLGVWIVACLLGWLREESVVRCDDYLRLKPPVSLLLPTATEIAQCRPGQTIPIGRYPRKFWQSPDGRWLRFTTQAGGDSQRPAGRFGGLICEVDLAKAPMEPRCLGGGKGKSHAIVGAESLGKVFLVAWSLPPDAQGRKSAIFTLPEEGPLAIEEEHRFDGSVADLIFEPKSKTLHIFCDENDRIRSVQLPGFERLPDTMAPVFPAQVQYDAGRDEGVVCSWLVGVAIRGNPLSVRFFGEQSPSIWSLPAISWGCDWDPSTRRVYAGIPNLGLLYEVDYDTGQILHRYWVGFGMRSATLDRRRGLVYLSNFLSGDLFAIDIHTGEKRFRWFVGHFVREAYLSRDGDSLFVSSNLGVVRIALGDLAVGPH